MDQLLIFFIASIPYHSEIFFCFSHNENFNPLSAGPWASSKRLSTGLPQLRWRSSRSLHSFPVALSVHLPCRGLSLFFFLSFFPFLASEISSFPSSMLKVLNGRDSSGLRLSLLVLFLFVFLAHTRPLQVAMVLYAASNVTEFSAASAVVL